MQGPNIVRVLCATLYPATQAQIVAIHLFRFHHMALLQQQRRKCVPRRVHPRPRFGVGQIVVPTYGFPQMLIRRVIDSTDPFAAAKPDARLIKLLLRARRFNAALAEGEGVPFAALAQREGVSRSYFTRLVRLSYLAPDLTQAILDGRQPRDLTTEKLLAHSRLPLAWHDQRIVLGFG